MRILGLDPGLRHTGWGVVESLGNRLRHIADGVIHSDAEDDLADRLADLFQGVQAVIARHAPEEAAVEETFVNRNPASTLKLGQARGVVLLAPALAGLSVAAYANNVVKKAVVGAGRAEKNQVGVMVRMLLPGCLTVSEDAADALAVAICHAHHRTSRAHMAQARAKAAS